MFFSIFFKYSAFIVRGLAIKILLYCFGFKGLLKLFITITFNNFFGV